MRTVLYLRHNDIARQIQLHSYYTGEARKAAGITPSFAARIQASDSENDIITRHMRTAILECSKLLSRYFSVCTTKEVEDDGSSTTEFHMQPPRNFPHECIPQLEDSMANYVAMRALQQWLAQNKPDEAVSVAEEVRAAANNMRETMSLRNRPHKNIQKKKRSIDI